MASLDAAQRWYDRLDDDESGGRHCEVCCRRGAPWSGARLMYVCPTCNSDVTEQEGDDE